MEEKKSQSIDNDLKFSYNNPNKYSNAYKEIKYVKILF